MQHKAQFGDPRFEPTPESPAWLAAMGDADRAAEIWLEEQEASASADAVLGRHVQARNRDDRAY